MNVERVRFLDSARRFKVLRAFTLLLFATVVLSSTGGCALVTRLSGGAVTPLQPARTLPIAAPVTGSAREVGLPSIAEVAAAVRPAVVFIATQELALDFFLQPTQQGGAGSGVIFDPKGYILTNNHVIENARRMRILLPDGRTFDQATVVGRDPLTDLAVLKIEGDNLPVAKLGDSDALRVGDWVIAIGNALGLDGGPTVTAGVVGATGRSIREPNGTTLDDLIQTDAAINPGNSGGPLVNLNGEVVGINTAIDSRGQGIGFAIGISSARPIIGELLQSGRVVRAFLGVTVATLNANVAAQIGVQQREGVAIVTAPRGGSAAQAGLRTGDVLTSLDGKPLKSARDLQLAIRERKPGDRVALTVVRSGGEQVVMVTLGELTQ